MSRLTQVLLLYHYLKLYSKFLLYLVSRPTVDQHAILTSNAQIQFNTTIADCINQMEDINPKHRDAILMHTN